MYNTISANKTGGCTNLIHYLEKEEELVKDTLKNNKDLSNEFAEYLDKENNLSNGNVDLFFNGEERFLNKNHVIDSINNNNKGLKNKESKFYSLTFSLSENEIHHVKDLAEEEINKIKLSGVNIKDELKVKEGLIRDMLKDYTTACMDEYAKNFNRDGIESNKDLNWYGKVERHRFWKHTDKAVRENRKTFREISKAEKEGLSPDKIQELKEKLILEQDIRKGGKNIPVTEMMPKSGENYHVHVIVSRRDKEQKRSLSPLAKARLNKTHKINGKECTVGFNRDNFSNVTEKVFDKSFNYERIFSESYEAKKIMKLDSKEAYLDARDKWNNERDLKPSRDYTKQINKQEYDNRGQQAKGATLTFAQKAGLNQMNETINPFMKIYSIGTYAYKYDKALSQAIETGKYSNVERTVKRQRALNTANKMRAKSFEKAIVNYAKLSGLTSVTPVGLAMNVGRKFSSEISKQSSIER